MQCRQRQLPNVTSSPCLGSRAGWDEGYTGLPGDDSEWAPPDPISNSEVKLLSADDSAVFRAKVGHCQALNTKSPVCESGGFFMQKGGGYSVRIGMDSERPSGPSGLISY